MKPTVKKQLGVDNDPIASGSHHILKFEAGAKVSGFVILSQQMPYTKSKVRALLSERMAVGAQFFAVCDKNRSGTIDRQEFTEAILGACAKGDVGQDVIDGLFDEFDTDSSGEITHAEFLGYLLRDTLHVHAKRVVAQLSQVDNDGAGEFEKWQFRRAIAATGLRVPDQAMVDEFFDAMDTNKNGKLTLQEIHGWLRHHGGHDDASPPADIPVRMRATSEVLVVDTGESTASPRRARLVVNAGESGPSPRRAKDHGVHGDGTSASPHTSSDRSCRRLADTKHAEEDGASPTGAVTVASTAGLSSRSWRDAAFGHLVRSQRKDARSLPLIRPPAKSAMSPGAPCSMTWCTPAPSTLSGGFHHSAPRELSLPAVRPPPVPPPRAPSRSQSLPPTRPQEPYCTTHGRTWRTVEMGGEGGSSGAGAAGWWRFDPKAPWHDEAHSSTLAELDAAVDPSLFCFLANASSPDSPRLTRYAIALARQGCTLSSLTQMSADEIELLGAAAGMPEQAVHALVEHALHVVALQVGSYMWLHVRGAPNSRVNPQRAAGQSATASATLATSAEGTVVVPPHVVVTPRRLPPVPAHLPPMLPPLGAGFAGLE